MSRLWPGLIISALLCQSLGAQPVTGDLFCEYRRFYEQDYAGQSIRIDGKQGQSHPDRGSEHDYINAPVQRCKPHEIPKKWVTRSGEKTESFDARGDLSTAVAAQLVWSSWSPGYMRGISVNGAEVFDHEGPKYQTYYHRVTLTDVSMFQPGRNVLSTGKTPKINGKMVHGMEVNWPGIMVLIRCQK